MSTIFTKPMSLLEVAVIKLAPVWVTCVLIIGLAHPAFSQATPGFEKAMHVYKKDTLPYRILYPVNFDRTKDYPVVLFLHGAGERGDDNEKQLVHGSKLFLQPGNRAQYPAIVVFPQCPKDDAWTRRAVKKVDGKRQFSFKKGGKPSPAMGVLVHLVDSLYQLPFVDQGRVYLGGLSMGGMGTFELAWRRPGMFAAAFPICGGGNPKNARQYAEKIPFWIFHGAKDDVVPPEYSEQMVAAIQAHGGQVKFSLYPEANHNSWDKAFAEPDLMPWLFSKSK